MVNKLNALSRKRKRLALVFIDTLILPIALWLSFYVRLGEVWPVDLRAHAWVLVAAPVLAVPVFIKMGMYRAVIRYMGSRAIYTIFQAVSVATLLLLAAMLMTHTQGLPRSSLIIYWALTLVLVGGSRMLLRTYVDVLAEDREDRIKIIIYGAGSAGTQLARALLSGREYLPVAFVDDNRDLVNSEIYGIRVYPPGHIANLLNRAPISQILLAVPSASNQRRREILEQLEPHSVHVRTMPGLADIVSGKARIDEIKEVDVEDVLGRDPVPPVEGLLEHCIKGRSVMISGAGGSIGSELTRQIAKLQPARLVLYELSEFALYRIEQELRQRFADQLEIVAVLGNICDKQLLGRTISSNAVDTIYHAAAYKHVPLVEANPIQAIRNNVQGTLTLANAAAQLGVSTFVLISTDKAVRPTNVMGATKRVAEMILQAIAQTQNSTRFVLVRFGNVLKSSGSVVPLFEQQIKDGMPLTVTHKEVTRYFMTIPEAAQLVLQAGSMGQGGDVFVLDMGEPVKILDLAIKMIHLAGCTPTYATPENADEIKIQFVGLRPGEKLYEELLIGDNVSGTEHPRILRAKEACLLWPDLHSRLEKLFNYCDQFEQQAAVNLLRSIINDPVMQNSGSSS